jgi:protocatechuate 3,4-dioxygenase beta subunit
MHNDDVMVGRLLTRRELVALLGLSGIAALADPVFGQAPGAAPLPACVVQPEQTEGPYFVDKMLNRSDIRPDPVSGAVKAGVPLRVAFNVARVAGNGGCTPISGAQVDLWQCDAAGLYSGVQDPAFDTKGQHFLRGHQITDARGAANFVTIYPGWYPGRAVHLHFKIRTTPAAQQGYEFTSQLYFDEELNDRVFAREPYSGRTGQRTRNEKDRIFASGGKELMLPVTAAGNGYTGSFSVGLHTDRTTSARPGRTGR